MIAGLWRSPEAERRADSLRVPVIVLACLLTLALLVASLTAPRLPADLVPAAMTPDGGAAYVAPIAIRPPFGFRIAGDSGRYPARSEMELRENGKLLGPPHANHAEMRSEGRGRYSHWRDELKFSASDSTDPAAPGAPIRSS